ncbi:MAG: HemK2/MTQ2 family protein methyltransferase [Nanoarchaeota archaeon]
MLYKPAEDSFLLQKQVRKYAKGKVLDLGTGTGIQALTALEKTPNVLASDINIEAVKHCKKLGIKAIKSDLFQNIKEKFDLIIFNPPYLPEDNLNLKDDKNFIGGEKGSEILEKFLSQAEKHLNKNGKILIVFSSLTPDVNKIIKKHKFKFKKLAEEKFFFEKLFVYLIY